MKFPPPNLPQKKKTVKQVRFSGEALPKWYNEATDQLQANNNLSMTYLLLGLIVGDTETVGNLDSALLHPNGSWWGGKGGSLTMLYNLTMEF